MARYTHYIQVPFTGSVCLAVETDSAQPSPDDLLSLVHEQCPPDCLTITNSAGDELEISEWDYHAHVVKGNVFYGSVSRIEIDDTDDGGE